MDPILGIGLAIVGARMLHVKRNPYVDEITGERFPDSSYLDRHHIKPRCEGGRDTPSNIISLTPNNHRVAHRGGVPRNELRKAHRDYQDKKNSFLGDLFY